MLYSGFWLRAACLQTCLRAWLLALGKLTLAESIAESVCSLRMFVDRSDKI